MKLYLVRHGETDINLKHLINGRNDVSLNETGICQAKKAALVLKDIDIDYIFCSPLERAKETCKYININNLPVIFDDRLMERDSGNLQFEKDDSFDINEWYNIDKEIIYNDTEGFKSIMDRLNEFLNYLKKEYTNKTVLVVTHGDVLKAVYLLITKDYDNYKNEYSNCEIVEYNNI